MDVALFVDPAPHEYAAAVEAATFVAEAAVSRGRPLILSCAPSAALEIGMATFGHAVARTVEGGERRPSPIVLLPLIGGAKDSVDRRLYPTAERGAGTLADLVDLGIFASREETDIDPFSDRDPVDAFTDTLRRRKTSIVFGLGSKSLFWTPTLSQLREIPQGRLVAVPGFAPSDLPFEDPAIVRIRRAEIPERPYRRDGDPEPAKDDFEQFVIVARQQAAVIAALIDSVLQQS
jgi:hypothetical protein